MFKKSILSLFAAVLMTVAGALPAYALSPDAVAIVQAIEKQSTQHTPATIRWSINAEDWVVGITGEVTVQVLASATTVEDASAQAYNAIEALRQATHWDWQSLGRGGNFGEGRSGMAEWVMEARARAPIADLQSVFQTATDLSIPGLRVTIINTDISPSLVEMEAGRTKLRAHMIEAAKAHAKALNARLSSIDFTPDMGGMPQPQPPMMRTMKAEMATDGGSAPRSGSVRIVETAVIEVQFSNE